MHKQEHLAPQDEKVRQIGFGSMAEMGEKQRVSTGIPALDTVIDGLRMGDNVVWQVDDLENYSVLARPFVSRAISEARKMVYIRFAPHPPILNLREGLSAIRIEPNQGFDSFSTQLNRIIEEQGPGTFYLFDNLSALLAEWATDQLLANFFKVTCPYLREMETVAYFALTRGQHSHIAVANIRDTTQVLIDVYYVQGRLYIQPLKVWDRYSPLMFLPHRVQGESLSPIFQSAEASSLLASASRQPLRRKAESSVPWETVYSRLVRVVEEGGASPEKTQEIQELKREFRRMMVGDHPRFNGLFDDYFTPDDLFAIRHRMIGTGRIGGKAAGMLLARRILENAQSKIDFSTILEQHDSFYIGSDVFFGFLVNNGLFRLRMRLSRGTLISAEEFEEVEERFVSGVFSPEIVEQFQDMLDYFGQAPIIVRSSSLLEDSFGNAFAGKYRSEFLANQGDPRMRLDSFLHALKLVYASAVNPDALAYRRRHGLGESDEQMAILVQRVSGFRYKTFFFPQLAGVAFSHNLYRWTDRIDPEQGMVRLVFGLGTRAVNRVGGDYPRIMALSHPGLQQTPESQLAAYSQRRVDLLDLSANTLATVPLGPLVSDADYPGLHLFVSIAEDGYVRDPVGVFPGKISNPVLTFNLLLSQTDFAAVIREMTSILEKAYGYAVDTEFTASVGPENRVSVNLLQCRPMRLPGTGTGREPAPINIRRGDVLFRARRMMPGGVVERLRYALYVDPAAYASRASLDMKKYLGRVVGRVNREVISGDEKMMIIGPGRWGSSNIDLGLNTSYSDISNASALVELAFDSGGHSPELSYGTHFFLDLVESEIIYLPVYPEDQEAEFNAGFFKGSPNFLTLLLSGADRYSEFIRVIDIPAVTGGRYARIVADAEAQAAVCYLVGESQKP